jgi:large subunit ribosomal protein L15
MDLSNLKPAKGAKQNKKRVGRGPGSGNGKTAGRGHKGAQSRSGYSFKRGFEGGQMPLHRRLPKRGFNNIFRTEYAVVNLDQLEERFEAGATVTGDSLREAGLIHGKRLPIKVLGRGEVTKALTVHAHKFSGKAAEKLAAAGGKAEAIASPGAAEPAEGSAA